jgi:hypothetical protein
MDIEVSVTKLGRSSIRFEFQTFKGVELPTKARWLLPARTAIHRAPCLFPMTCVQSSPRSWSNRKLRAQEAVRVGKREMLPQNRRGR